MRNEALSFALADYDFGYPEELVASTPAEPRDSARLLVLDRSSGRTEHAVFHELPGFLASGDCLVLNRTRVLPARLVGHKPTGGKVELLLVRELEPGVWTALAERLKSGDSVLLPQETRAEVLDKGEAGQWRLRFSTHDVAGLMERHGLAPLPPYIAKRRAPGPTASSGERKNGSASGDGGYLAADRNRYQTVYAREQGSIAAPTAGLHFTPELLAKLRALGIQVVELTLHVGLGTFRPLTAQDVRGHAMLPERFSISASAARALESARERGGRIVAVGTTAVRSLETWASTGRLEGETALFIHPGHEFKAIDALITNFHQPRSTPLLLASAFSGRERLLAAYREAFARRYRLFSYGDAMLVS